MPNATGQEQSAERGRPLDLYTFSWLSSSVRYVNTEDAGGLFNFQGIDYTPEVIGREKIQKTGEVDQSVLNVTVDISNEVAALFIGTPPASRVEILIQRVHETMSPLTILTQFRGYVESMSVVGGEATLKCYPFNEFFRREVPRFTYQGLCNHDLYDSQCGVLEATSPNRLTGTVLSVTQGGKVLEVQGASGVLDNKSPLQAFKGGFARNQASTDYRQIIDQDGDFITIISPFRENVSGVDLVLQRGCDHDPFTCRDKFSNIDNFGGFPYIPEVNPFTQSNFVGKQETAFGGAFTLRGVAP